MTGSREGLDAPLVIRSIVALLIGKTRKNLRRKEDEYLYAALVKT